MRTNAHRTRLLCERKAQALARGRLLPEYRLYYLDNANRIKHAVEFDCDSDNDADRVAMERTDGRAMELWSGTRLVRKFLPVKKAD